MSLLCCTNAICVGFFWKLAFEQNGRKQSTDPIVDQKSAQTFCKRLMTSTLVLEGSMSNLYLVGITTEEEKNSFDYLRSLQGNDKAHLTVDLGQIDLLINTKP